jgi:hypothetical protein
MKKTQLEQLSKSLIPRWYAFAFTLIADELMAEQLVSDALTYSLLKEQDEWREFVQDKKINKHQVFKLLLPAIYKLACKRSAHGKIQKQQHAFFNLDLNVKAVLYAKYKLGYNQKQMQVMFELSLPQIHIATLVGMTALKEIPPEFNQYV